MTVATIDAAWLRDPDLQALLAALANGEGADAARVVGGAVRNTLLGLDVADIDIATTTLPDATTQRAAAAGFKVVPTGIEHGTVTVVTPSRPFEVTTLRRDVETDGRHARVLFGRDWQADAERRDFTINALACEADGTVVDLVGGLPDLRSGTLRFIGEAARRIEEDYLRILRFFRFFAWYGTGRPDGEGLRAATRLKGGLDRLSAERVWSELRKTLGAPDPSRALLWMRQTGVLTAILPESERWGIDAIHGLVDAERLHGWPADPLLRLAAIVPPDAERLAAMARRLRFSNADRDRMLAFAEAGPITAGESETAFRGRLYFGDRGAIVDRLRLLTATELRKAPGDEVAFAAAASLGVLLKAAATFDPPPFPVTGEDLRQAGIPAGPALGAALLALKRCWVESGFVLGRDRLLERLPSAGASDQGEVAP